MGGRKRVHLTLNDLIERSIDERVKEEVGKRWMTVIDDVGKGNTTTAVQDTLLTLKYYATAKCMMRRIKVELDELHSYLSAVEAMEQYPRNKRKMTKIHKAKQERYDNLEADHYKLKTWLSDVDFAIEQLKDPEHKKWIVGRYVLEKTDAEIKSGMAGICGAELSNAWGSECLKDALNVLKYYLFPMKALREDVLNVKNKNALLTKKL